MPANIIITEPIRYLNMIQLMAGAWKILTDYGGMQKEAYMLGVPCITLRENTEWVETVEAGWNVLVGVDCDKILNTINCFDPKNNINDIYGHFVAKQISTIFNDLQL